MKLIPQAAYLKVCPKCQNHASIVFSNNEETAQFGKTVEAHREVTVALSINRITKEEALHLRSEINNWNPSQTWEPTADEDSILEPAKSTVVVQPVANDKGVIIPKDEDNDNNEPRILH